MSARPAAASRVTPAAPRLTRRADHTRTSRIVLTGLWADAILVMAASAWNGGQAFEALGQHRAEGIALGLAVDVGLAVALIGDRALHLAGRQSQWGRALRVVTALMSLALNCGVQLWQGHYGVAAFHAFLPVLLVLLSEYAQDSTLQFGEIAAEHQAAVQAERDAQLAADRAAWEAEQAKRTAPSYPTVSPAGDSRPGIAPIPPAAPPLFRAVPNRPRERTAARSSGSTRTGAPGRAGTPHRNSSTRRQTGQPRTDAQLSRAIRELAEANGGSPPSQYAVKQAFGVGSSRAARLLAELTTTPAGPPADNGAATRKDGTR